MNSTRLANALTTLLVLGSFLACDAVVGNDLDATSLSNNQGIACGEAVCDMSTEICCVAFNDDTYTSACLAQEETCEGTGLHWPLWCDGPEDCGGNACCGNLSTGVECSDSDSCPNDIGYYCQTSDDCPGGRDCLSATIGEFPVKVCDDP